MDRMTLKNPSSQPESTFWENFVLPILKYKRVTYTIVTTSVLATLAVCLIMKNKYTSTATILPSGPAILTSELKNLAAGSVAELGLGATSQAGENSSALYPDILGSRLISERIIKRNYSFYHRSRARAMSLEEYIDAPNIDRALRRLNKLVTIKSDRKTGVITVSVTTKYPELSAAVAHAYLEELDDYNIHHRQSTASENQKFTAKRLLEIKAELAEAEDSLRSFKEANMNYMISNDPDLQLELARLQREADMKASLYLTMAQQNELARIEAVKDIPVVQILDRGTVPQEKTSPRRSLYLAGALMGSFLISILISLWLDISVRRGLRAGINRVISSPSVRMNRVESRIAERIKRIAGAFEKEEKEI